MFRVSIVTALVAAVLAALAGTATAATPAAPAAPAAGAAVASAGTLDLRFVLTKVVASGKQLIAQGEVVGTVQTATGTTQVVRKPFSAPVRSLTRSTQGTRSTQRANRICDILNLNLAPLRLELLGLIIELDRVVLTIRANSRGGLLGSLLCGLAGPANANAQANRLNNALRRGGISALYAATLPLVPTTLPSPALLPPVPAGICTVLDLVLGPLDLNLLGLMIHLDRVHLRITADPNGGILGSLLCGLAGGLPPIIPPTPAP
jgi:hypothetical protein